MQWQHKAILPRYEKMKKGSLPFSRQIRATSTGRGVPERRLYANAPKLYTSRDESRSKSSSCFWLWYKTSGDANIGVSGAYSIRQGKKFRNVFSIIQGPNVREKRGGSYLLPIFVLHDVDNNQRRSAWGKRSDPQRKKNIVEELDIEMDETVFVNKQQYFGCIFDPRKL